MGKLKRVPFEKKKEVLHRGKRFYRTAADAHEAKKVLQAYAPQKEDYKLVEMAAANNVKRKELAEHFGIEPETFTKHFDAHYKRGKLRCNLRVTDKLFNAATGTEGVWDEKKRRWIERPTMPDMTAVIWWDKTRGGWAETVNHKGKGMGGTVNNNRVNTQVMVFLPPNGREVGAQGDKTYIGRKVKEAMERRAAAQDQ